LGNKSATQQRRNLGGIKAVVLGFAAVNCPHVEGMSQDEGNPLILAEIGEPGPGEHALDADHYVLTEGAQRLEKCVGIGADVFVHAHLAVGISDAEAHPVDVQVDAAVKLVLSRVKSHRVSSLLRGMGRHLQDTG
jgi:hypothetical protein